MKIPWDDVVKAIIVFALTGVIGYFAMLMVRFLKTLPAKGEQYLIGIWVRASTPLLDEMALVKDKLEWVELQLMENGGKTLRDAVGRLEVSLEQMSAINEALLGFHDENRGWFRTDQRGDLVWISSQVLRWVRRSREEVIGSGSGSEPRWRSMIAPECQAAVESWWRHTHSAGAESSMKQTYISTDGERIHVMVRATPVFSTVTRELLAYVGRITRIGYSEIPPERTSGIAD